MNLVKTFLGLFLLASWCIPELSATNLPAKPAKSLIPAKAQVFTTAKDTRLRLTQTSDAVFENFGQPFETQVCIFVNPLRTFQTLTGIGGALTDASAEVFAKLPETSQKELLTAYYDTKTGIGYKFARTNIASCDFSSDSYGYEIGRASCRERV